MCLGEENHRGEEPFLTHCIKGAVCCARSLQSHPTLWTLWTVAHQASLSIGFSRQEYWSGLLCPSPGDLPGPGIEPVSLMSPALAGGFSTTNATWETTLSRVHTTKAITVDVDLDHWVWGGICLLSPLWSHAFLAFFFHPVLLEVSYWRSGRLCFTALRVEYLYKPFWILHRRLVCSLPSPHLFIYSITYLHQHGLMDINFIL